MLKGKFCLPRASCLFACTVCLEITVFIQIECRRMKNCNKLVFKIKSRSLITEGKFEI